MNVFLFDIDGTLISSGGAGRAALEQALVVDFGYQGTIDRIPLSGRTDRAIIRDLLALVGITDTDSNVQRLVAAYLAQLPGCLDRSTGKVLPGIAGLLKGLQVRPKTVVGLLTGNIRAGARVKLGYFDLFHHFELGGFGDQHLCRNDVAREALVAVRAHLPQPVAPECIWVIGDTPLDIRCARAIGARAVAVATGLHSRDELTEDQPDLLLEDLSDPEPLLALCG